MGWLQRLFGIQKPQSAGNQQQSNQSATATAPTAPAMGNTGNMGQSAPPERVGLNGEYDQSGLAKRVALAFDEDPNLDDINTLYVAQTGSTVVLKGTVPDRQILDRMVSVARGVNGATAVDTSQVTTS